jgi:hypothetical protein
MSAAADFVKDVGPIVIGIGGLVVAFANSRQPGREARHHARVENLYQDMLNLLEFRIENGMRAHSIGEIDRLPIPVPEAHKVTSARLRLYATPDVRAAWGRAYMLSGVFEAGPDTLPGGEPRMLSSMQELWALERVVDELVDRMRADLGVPKAPIVLRARWWKANLVSQHWTKKELRKIQRRRQSGVEEPSKEAGA